MVDVSRGTAYGVGFSQCAVMLGVILFFPPVDVDVYLFRVHLNITSRTVVVDPGKDVEGERFFMAMPMLLCSLMAAGFSAMTYNAYEAGFGGHDYVPEALEEASMWNLVFWMHCLLVHGIVVFVISDPVDVFGAVSATSFMVFFLHRVCFPKGQSVSLIRENLNILGYSFGILLAAYQITGTRDNGSYVIAMVVVFDYFLGFGHTYDRQATLDTVANCRLFYVCAVSLSLALLYAMSGEPPLSSRA